MVRNKPGRLFAGAALQIPPPLLQGENYCKSFPVGGIPVPLGHGKGLARVRNDLIPMGAFLG